MTKTAEKPYPLGPHIPIQPMQGSTPPPQFILIQRQIGPSHNVLHRFCSQLKILSSRQSCNYKVCHAIILQLQLLFLIYNICFTSFNYRYLKLVFNILIYTKLRLEDCFKLCLKLSYSNRRIIFCGFVKKSSLHLKQEQPAKMPATGGIWRTLGPSHLVIN